MLVFVLFMPFIFLHSFSFEIFFSFDSVLRTHFFNLLQSFLNQIPLLFFSLNSCFGSLSNNNLFSLNSYLVDYLITNLCILVWSLSWLIIFISFNLVWSVNLRVFSYVWDCSFELFYSFLNSSSKLESFFFYLMLGISSNIFDIISLTGNKGASISSNMSDCIKLWKSWHK